MGMFKFRQNVHCPGMTVSGVTSTADLDIRSTAALDSMTVTNQMSAGLLTVDSTFQIGGNVVGNAAFRGLTSIASGDDTVTISAAAITSGAPVQLFAQSSAGQLIPSSVVDNVSFMAEAVDGATATGPLNLSYVIIR